MQTTTKTHTEIPGLNLLILNLLDDIKTLWDDEGFGSNEHISERLYARLSAAIRLLQQSV